MMLMMLRLLQSLLMFLFCVFDGCMDIRQDRRADDPCLARFHIQKLFEKHWSEGVQVQSPVGPYVSAVGLIEDMVESLLGEYLVKSL